ncbi:MAG TPA: hypothetical protein VM845_04710 [Burkholderiaceae bacterium]|jgi:hypothetical protein|nr:hypothetical protein [Burkholderiaceae bacterium]
MPKSRAHWGYDLLTVLLVALVGAFVFWVVPAQAEVASSLVARVAA